MTPTYPTSKEAPCPLDNAFTLDMSMVFMYLERKINPSYYQHR